MPSRHLRSAVYIASVVQIPRAAKVATPYFTRAKDAREVIQKSRAYRARARAASHNDRSQIYQNRREQMLRASEKIHLADLNTAVAQQVVGSGHVKVKVWQHPVEQVIQSLEIQSIGAGSDGDRALL
jgi:hypothetical protein